MQQLRDQHRSPINYLIVGDHTFSGPSLLDGWALYFESLATPSCDPAFDEDFKASIMAKFEQLYQLPYHLPDKFLLSEVQQVIAAVPLSKSPGPDGGQAKHLCYDKQPLVFFLTNLFNAILGTGHIPAFLPMGM